MLISLTDKRLTSTPFGQGQVEDLGTESTPVGFNSMGLGKNFPTCICDKPLLGSSRSWEGTEDAVSAQGSAHRYHTQPFKGSRIRIVLPCLIPAVALHQQHAHSTSQGNPPQVHPKETHPSLDCSSSTATTVPSPSCPKAAQPLPAVTVSSGTRPPTATTGTAQCSPRTSTACTQNLPRAYRPMEMTWHNQHREPTPSNLPETRNR